MNSNQNNLLQHSTLNPVDSEESQVTVNQITTFDVSAPVESGTCALVHNERDVPPLDQNVIEVLSRPYQIVHTVNWETSDTPGAVLFNFDPLRYILDETNIQRKLLGYQNFRCAIRVRFQLAGNAFLAGKCSAFWVPLNRMGEYDAGLITATSVSGMQQHIDMYPIDASTYEMVIHPLLPKRYWSLETVGVTWDDVWPISFASQQDSQVITETINASFVSAGLISINVLQPLIAQDPADIATITCWVNMECLELDQAYQASSDRSWPSMGATTDFHQRIMPVPSNGLVTYQTGIRKRVMTGVYPVVNSDVTPAAEANKKEAAGRWSLMTQTAADLMKTFIPISGIYAPLVAAMSLTTTGFSHLLAYFRFDKPRETALPNRMLQVYKNMPYSDGVDEAQMASMSSSNAVCPIGVHQPFDAASLQIGTLAGISQVIYQRTMALTDMPGATLFGWAVAPWNCPNYKTATIFPDYNSVQYLAMHTNASWLSRMFQYWRGDCVVTVEAIAPAFAKAYLKLAWIPGNAEYSHSPAFCQDGTFTGINYAQTETKNTYMRVSGNTTVSFRIPYRSIEYALNADITKLPITPDNLNGANMCSTNGTFQLLVGQSISGFSPAGAAAPQIGIIVSVAFPGLQLFRPSTHQMESWPMGIFPRNPSLPESDILEEVFTNSDTTDTETLGLAPSQFFGESITDVLTLARRPANIGGGQTVDNSPLSDIFSLFYSPVCFARHYTHDVWQDKNDAPPAIGVPGNTQLPSNVPAWISRLFLSWRGEVTYTVLPAWDTGVSELPGKPECRLQNVDLRMWPFASGYGPGSLLDSTIPRKPETWLVGNAEAYGSGAIYRPADSAGIPATVVVPYYSKETFHLTPSFYANGINDPPNPATLGTLYFNESCPAVCTNAQTTDGSPRVHVFANIGDNFSYGGYYPPTMSMCSASKGYFESPSLWARRVTEWPGEF